MHISKADSAQPFAGWEQFLGLKDVPKAPAGGSAGLGQLLSTALDDPDLCPPWPPLPFPHHGLADLVASLGSALHQDVQQQAQAR